MKLVRFERGGAAQLGVVDGSDVVPLEKLKDEFPTMLSLIAEGDAALAKARVCAQETDDRVPLNSARLLAPVERPGKFLAIGMNFRKHAEEGAALGFEKPKQQFVNRRANGDRDRRSIGDRGLMRAYAVPEWRRA
ncbi:DUF2437 domain-containing protein [Sphingobium phenoxybenzoativorans]|uniref:DUF2437 domain-containing protein n=1 Tax=Sphingobium phenoxybenzoativorans TaxID=1592790 RepID=A0A975Q1A8_9SPHN|nr:DUF2437 domain-containing protein [Sphingobium phenoxybenzoativorans]QUT05619.1 DUF2437 domain-containing protein [Sphingobium phenoxybenzoativorans]